MIDTTRAVNSVIEKLERKSLKSAEEEIDIKNMSEAIIRETLVFIDNLDRTLRTKSMGSIERFNTVHRASRILEVRLHVTVLGKSKVLKFGVHRTKIVVGGQRESDEVSPSGPVYNQEQLIDWLSNQIISAA
ncbi:hypothetical protein ABLE91_15770 [Aquabacter sp. CN5-332]|uniref:hypothetical protein n=1 Tax=Aquabacter sp. CN5-332 TaxID=3156608 RepID=UPI0032B4315A